MAFADEIAKPVSVRHALVRLTPARCVNDDLTLVSGRKYTMSFPYPIARVEGDGEVFSEVATVSGNEQWSHSSSGTLTVQFSNIAAPGAGNVCVVYYYLFYTSAEAVEAVECYQTPTSSATPMRIWQPRLMSEPRFRQGISDVFYGTFSVEATSFAIANHDNAFQAYLTDSDSFNNKAAEAWISVNGELQKVYSGLIKGIAIDNDTVTLELLDGFAPLRQPAYMGDDFDEAHYVGSSGAATGPILTADQGIPVPCIFGKNRAGTGVFVGTDDCAPIGLYDLRRRTGPVSTGYLYSYYLSPEFTTCEARSPPCWGT